MTNFHFSDISTYLTSASVQVPHLTAQDHLHTETELYILSILFSFRKQNQCFCDTMYQLFVCPKALSWDKK